MCGDEPLVRVLVEVHRLSDLPFVPGAYELDVVVSRAMIVEHKDVWHAIIDGLLFGRRAFRNDEVFFFFFSAEIEIAKGEVMLLLNSKKLLKVLHWLIHCRIPFSDLLLRLFDNAFVNEDLVSESVEFSEPRSGDCVSTHAASECILT